jgi:hypothetical protein
LKKHQGRHRQHRLQEGNQQNEIGKVKIAKSKSENQNEEEVSCAATNPARQIRLHDLAQSPSPSAHRVPPFT